VCLAVVIVDPVHVVSESWFRDTSVLPHIFDVRLNLLNFVVLVRVSFG